MALADDLQELQDRYLSALNASHDYYAHTQAVWRLMQRIVKEGRKFGVRNRSTGSSVTEQDLQRLAQHYITDYHTSFTFQHFVTLFESWFFDLLRLWLLAYPSSLGKRQVEFSTVLQAPDKTAITLAVVDKELNDIKYTKVADWFAFLEKLANLGLPAPSEIERLAEIKASRDILVHNKGVANAVYVAKAGNRARYREGEKIEIPEHYHREAWECIRRVIQEISNAACEKLLAYTQYRSMEAAYSECNPLVGSDLRAASTCHAAIAGIVEKQGLTSTH